MAPQLNRADPPYVQIVADIRQQILDGKLHEGDTVPSARQISKDWGVALATATKVLAALRADGLAEGVPGVGTVVRIEKTARYTLRDRVGVAKRTGRIYPDGEYAKITSAQLVDASAHIADALGIEPGTQVIRRHRVTYNAEDVPVAASTSWFVGTLAEKAPRLLETDRIVQGTFGYIESVTGRAATSGRDQMSARAATADEGEDLSVTEGSPIMAARNWLYDQDGNVIEYGEGVRAADRWSSYDYNLT